MRFLLLLLLTCTAPAFASALSILETPLAMTITQILAMPTDHKVRLGTVSVIPERKNVFLLEKDGDLKFTYRLQTKKTAPVVFLLPGTGGSARSPGVLFLAEKLFNLGYTTITVDNGFSWQFAVAGSSTGLPGYTPQDAKDLYRGLQAITRSLKTQQELRPSSYSLAGYSLGASQSLFLQNLDEQKKSFNFEKVLMINPPVDLLYAVTQLDRLYQAGEKLSPNRQAAVYSKTLEAGSAFLDKKSSASVSDIDYLQKVFDQLQFNTTDMSYLIGGSFRDSLRDVIFASQQVHDLKILKSPVTRYRRNMRYEESRRFSFNEYMRRFVFASVQTQKNKDYTIEDMNREVSLYQFEQQIMSRKNLFLVHSQDDFILKSEDVGWLKEKFGNRALIFPYGGHCGALNFPQFSDHLTQIF